MIDDKIAYTKVSDEYISSGLTLEDNDNQILLDDNGDEILPEEG